MKCAKCSHHWVQEPSANPSSAPTTDIKEEEIKKAEDWGANLPAKVKYDPVPNSLLALAVVFVVMAYFSTHFLSYRDALGVQKTEGLVFSEMEVNVRREANHLAAYITGEIKNESSDKSYVLPEQVYFKLWSGQKRVMAETTYDLPEKTLEPGESVALTPRIGNISGNAAELVVDIGNGMERFFRE